MITLPVFQGLNWLEAHFYNAEESKNITDTICMKQPHFVDAIWVDKKPDEWLECDALMTDKANLNLTVRTADCAPILLADTEKHIVAAIHAGWKSAVQGLIENTVHLMQMKGCQTQNIIAGIGPHLQVQSFEVSPEMKGLFPPIHQHFFTEDNGRILFDFDGYVQMRLRRLGIKQIQSDGTDTYSDMTYNSYRRNPQDPARQFSVIKIKEV
ncbi:MAG: peptidoglycan editing factor PgeF [Alphaproteobacteria bacterium]|nr:peptidoglycan editing factor PgeF [Alphaproteobacteria bacterium]